MVNEPVSHQDLVSRIERLLGAKVETCRLAEGGYTPALRWLCQTTHGTFFVKAGTTPLTSEFLRREIHVYNRIQGDFMPRLVAWEEHVTAPILITEDLSAHHWPPPWNVQRIALVLAQIEAMHNTRASLELYARVHNVPGLG